MSMSKNTGRVTIPTPVVVNTDDLTLDELDRANKLTQDGSCGNVAALAFVWLKRELPGVKLDDVKQLRSRDVDVTDDDELAAHGQTPTDATAADPTQ